MKHKHQLHNYLVYRAQVYLHSVIDKDGNEKAKSKEAIPTSTLLKSNEDKKKGDQKEEDKITTR